jgi:hypothetical protein
MGGIVAMRENHDLNSLGISNSCKRTTREMGSLTRKASPTSFLAPRSARIFGRATYHCRRCGGDSRCRGATGSCPRGIRALVARVGGRRFGFQFGFDHGRVRAEGGISTMYE